MFRNHYNFKKAFIGIIPKEADLYDAISKIAEQEDIRIGKVTAIGAVSEATIAYFDQDTKEYKTIHLKDKLEILNCTGNISLKNGKPFLHAHIIVGDKHGNAFGGHLMNGTKVFACEIFIEEFSGEDLNREKDEDTNLFLWKNKNLI